ncbi:MAG: DUF4239 domain-containing protein [Alphaproteobacteria bacterium]|nr:DUF4239 domain-containing protein [Alphaproteobacteria bacterium]MBV8406439.1 DUF4239 domain-containing protein [Alphaproteobacteria bacterium]
MDQVFNLPDAVILGVPAAVMAIAIILLPSLVHRIPWMKPGSFNTDFIIRIQATLFTMTALVLAFTLVQTESYNRRTEGLISTEASHINRMDRLLARYGTDAATTLRSHLMVYAGSIVHDEWSSMLKGRASAATHHAWDTLSRGLLALEPQTGRQSAIFAELLKSLNSMVESRDERLAAVADGLPRAYWMVVGFTVAMLLFVSSTIERTAFSATVLAAQMAVIGAVLGFVIIQDHPLKAHTAIGPGAIVEAMGAMKQRGD